MKRCSPKHLPKCDETVVQKAEFECKPFSFCTIKGEVTYDGRCMFFTPSANPIADGWYTAVQFVDGCLVAAAVADSPGYTPPDCCGGTGGGGGGGGGAATITLNPDPANITVGTPSGLLSKVYFQNTSTVTITGTGTASDPFMAAVSSSTLAGASTVGVPPINVVGAGTTSNPFIVSLNQVSSINPGEYNGFSIDPYGRVVGYDPAGASAVTVTGQHPVSVTGTTTSTGTNYLVKLDGTDVNVTVGQRLKVTKPNATTFHIELDFDPMAVTRQVMVGAYTVRLNGMGGIVDIVAPSAGTSGEFYVLQSAGGSPRARVTYSGGLITNVVNV